MPSPGLWWSPFGCACQLVPGHALGVHNEHVILVVAAVVQAPKNEQAAIWEGGACVPRAGRGPFATWACQQS